MIKVMLVDDEPIEREGLMLMLLRNRSNIQVVAEASNGQKAVELALEHKPDLIFMDIKMPRMDGVQAVKEILSKLPTTKCIMVSAFNTFEYAQQVMKYGVKEYLLKPSKLSDVLEAVDRMVMEIEETQKNKVHQQELSQRLERISTLVEREFVFSMMMDDVHDFQKEDWDQWLDLQEKSGFVIIFSFQAHDGFSDRKDKERWYQRLRIILHEQNLDCLVGPLINYQVPVFVFSSKGTVQEDVLLSTISAFQHKESARLLAGTGSVVEHTGYFPQSYEEAVYALESVYNHQTANYMIFHPELKKKRQELIPFEKEKELIEAIKEGDLQRSLQQFDTYFQLVHEASQHELKETMKRMEEFFSVLTRPIKELGIDEEVQLSLQMLESPMQVRERAKSHLISIMEHIREWRKNDIDVLLLNTKAYIDHNYHKQITLDDVAEKVGLSSYYLSKLFKDRFDITFIDYLTQARLNKAKKFLRDDRLSLKEIALTIGYKDPNYFSRVFKKETDLSPSEYRRKLMSTKK
ncbi:response regulator [Bacillus sp. PS06]|uniref:response regulator n=1 Tax=Bacillus sp. PS06 TaxID=2764176 RepID=UPI0017842206|nr:response regulator [Bacillus sp. PS06]MBD8070653.1 response regulator [Bacillus sp. PS06]